MVNAVDLEEGLPEFLGRGRKERIVPVGGEAIQAIRKLFTWR